MRFGGLLVENRLENLDDELHRGVVVVQQQNLVEVRFLRFLPCALENFARRPAIRVCHELIDCSRFCGRFA
jgi:hypothetical protein